MNRYTPRRSAEFEARQFCFAFGDACRFVADLTAKIKNDLKKWAFNLFKPVLAPFTPPEQRILDLNFEDFPQWQKT
ncbi:MAG: hypothetical protein Q8N89_08375 [Azonexus sp.]|nr:hypothetical protein [Azonexus sp.]